MKQSKIYKNSHKEIVKSIIKNMIGRGTWKCVIISQHCYESISESISFHLSPSEFIEYATECINE